MFKKKEFVIFCLIILIAFLFRFVGVGVTVLNGDEANIFFCGGVKRLLRMVSLPLVGG